MNDNLTEELERALEEGKLEAIRQMIEIGIPADCWNAEGYKPMSRNFGWLLSQRFLLQ
jgi:hypothetical protein